MRNRPRAMCICVVLCSIYIGLICPHAKAHELKYAIGIGGSEERPSIGSDFTHPSHLQSDRHNTVEYLANNRQDRSRMKIKNVILSSNARRNPNIFYKQAQVVDRRDRHHPHDSALGIPNPTIIGVRTTRNANNNYPMSPYDKPSSSGPLYVVMRHSLKPFIDNRRGSMVIGAETVPENSDRGLTVEERPYVYIEEKQSASDKLIEREQYLPTAPTNGFPTIYTSYSSPDQVRMISSRNAGLQGEARFVENQFSKGEVNLAQFQNNDPNFFDYEFPIDKQLHIEPSTSPKNFEQNSESTSDEEMHSIEKRIEKGPILDADYREVLPPHLINNHRALLQLLSSTGAEKLLHDLRTKNDRLKEHHEQSDKKEEKCDCGPPTSTGTVVGLTGLAALLIYALSMQTISTVSSSASGRALMPNSHGYIESFMKDMVERHAEPVHQRFPGLTWNQYRDWKTHSVYKDTLLNQLQNQRPFTDAFDIEVEPVVQAPMVRAQRRNYNNPKPPPPTPGSSLLDRIQRWIQGRGKRVYRTINTTSPDGLSSSHSPSSSECQCGLQQMLDLLSYVPLAVMLGYSTTISTAALTTGSNTGGSTSGATNIGVTINDADVISNSNNNAPTLTNSDSDVLSVVAQGSPVNTNTNTASNQDSDMISNSIIGGRRRRRKRSITKRDEPATNTRMHSATRLTDTAR